MSSSDRVMRSPRVSPRRVRVGDPRAASPITFDVRPQTVREAEARHARDVAALRAQHQAALEAAYRNGYNDGAAMVRDEAQRELRRTSELVSSLVSEFTRTRAAWFAACEQQVVELVCRALEQVLGDRPPVAERVLHALRRAGERLGESDRVTIRCHPDDLEFIRAALEHRPDELIGHRRVTLAPDEGVQTGGCLVETDLGIIDARVEQQLRILRGALLEAAASADVSADGSPSPRPDDPPPERCT